MTLNNLYFFRSCSKGTLMLLNLSLKIIALREEAHEIRPVIRVKFSPRGNYLASSGEDKKIKVWSVPQLRIIHQQIELHYSRVSFSNLAKNTTIE